MKKQIFILVLTISSLTSNAQNFWNSKKIKGNGNIITQTRKITTFDQISIGGSFDAVLIDGTENKLTINGEENVLKYIETIVKKNELVVQFKENTNIKLTKKLVVTIPFEKINDLSLGGSGNIIANKKITTDSASFSIGGSGSITASVNANTIKASIGGSGSIKLKGKTDALKINIAGSGNIKAYNLKTNTLKANIAGSGNIKATVNSKIKANIVGSGNVYYKGNPNHIDLDAIGSGKAKSMN